MTSKDATVRNVRLPLSLSLSKEHISKKTHRMCLCLHLAIYMFIYILFVYLKRQGKLFGCLSVRGLTVWHLCVYAYKIMLMYPLNTAVK